MEPSREAIAVRMTRLNRQILGKLTSGTNKFIKRTIDREALLDALTVLYDECNDDPVKKSDELVRAFVDKYRSTLAELRRTRVCYSDFEVLQTIGRGYFGDVHMVREKQTGDVYALKSVRKELARKRTASAEDEREVLATASSPWIPRLQYAFQDTSNLYLVMELCSGGDLAGLLARRNHPLPERDAAFYVAEVAHALKALHGMGYVHRDVKPHNVLLDRCGHVKLGDFGSCARLSEGAAGAAGAAGAGAAGGGDAAAATADYVAPELLAAAHCAATHTVCSEYCRGIVTTAAISACDYWSLGVVAFELVTLRRPFSSGEEDSVAQILSNIQRYEREPNSEPPFDPFPNGPSNSWRSLVSGLLRVQPARRYNYLDTLQHAALAHIAVHSVRDQAPPWVPLVRGAEDASCFTAPPRRAAPPTAAPFRSRPPFAGQLPFVGYSYVAADENEDSSGGFNASHDCTAIDLATFKSAEKLAAMRSREVASLQTRLAAAEAAGEAAAGAAAERARRDADAEAERVRARLQADITALTLQNKRLERQVEVEREERMALQRTNQELSSGAAEARRAQAVVVEAAALEAERDQLREATRRLEARVEGLQADCARALAAADAQRLQHHHYKDILEHVQELRHRRLTEINVRPIDTVAKERAIRRQTLTGLGATEGAETAARAAAAEAEAAREARARGQLEARLASLDADYQALQAQNKTLQAELDDAKKQLAAAREMLNEKQREGDVSAEKLSEMQIQIAQERVRVSTLLAQVQELERAVEESVRREAALEEQGARTEARLHERLRHAEARAASASRDDARHREKVNTLEQLVRQLEREVSALEARGCASCAARGGGGGGGDASAAGGTEAAGGDAGRHDAHSDTESVGDAAHAQLALLKEQLERAEGQLQARAEEMATLRQEVRAANLARWRKEREFNELSSEAKSTARELKRLEERLSCAVEARKTADQKANSLQTEMARLRPQYERATKDAERFKEQLEKLQKTHEIAQAEVDRSRNDIRKLKSELQYSEKRRLHAEREEERSSGERAHSRAELADLRARTLQLEQNNKALQEACGLLEEQLTDLEKLADINELKNKDLEIEIQRMRTELETCRGRLAEAEKQASERGAEADAAARQHGDAREQARHAHCQLQLLRERLESREARVSELEGRVAALEGDRLASEAALGSAARRIRDLQEESATLRTRAHDHHAHALQLQASLADAQEELAAAREAAEAASAWWRTRETKADATLRQQAKLIDFLQAKVEEAGRKKCSLSNKLFGRSGRRPVVSPPLRRANRELREEVDRLRAKLAASNSTIDMSNFLPTPKKDRPKAKVNGMQSIDTPDRDLENSLLIVWPDGARERMRARVSEGTLVLTSGDRELRAQLHDAEAKNLPQNEANRAFTIKVDSSAKGSTAVVVCSSLSERDAWRSRVSRADRPLAAGYAPALLARLDRPPAVALHVAPNAVAIGCEDGLHSLRGAIRLEWECETEAGAGGAGAGAVRGAAAAGGRALVAAGARLVHCGVLALGSTLRRAAALRPALCVARVRLPDGTPPHLVKALSGDTVDGPCAAVACGRRVFLLRFDASVSEFKIARSLTVDRPPTSLLLTARALYIAGEKPLRINLPSGALEAFAMDEPTVAAAARKHSPPKAILLVRDKPIEILLCYAECGVFVDENGKRTRNDDPRWSSAVKDWEFVSPFLYVIEEDRIAIIVINDEAYRAPPCTCDATSLASTESDCYSPEIFTLKVQEPFLLGTAPNGIIIRSKVDDGYSVSIVEGMTAFRSIGASIESLETISTKGSSTDLARSLTDLSPHDMSQESVEPNTGFLADIRKRARQLRTKTRHEQTSDDVIKEILTTEVGLKRSTSAGRRSPATTSEFDSDSTESEERTESTKCTTDLCAEMFTRQVRFQ